jgi:hypothetical protein
MLLVIAGAGLIALGLFSGVVLLLAPLGLVPWSADAMLWVAFPLFSMLGYVLFVVGGRHAQVRALSIALSALFLLLALGAAAALVLGAAAVVGPIAQTAPLWYVMVVAGVLGIGDSASYRLTPAQA